MQQLIAIKYVEASKRANYVLQNTFDDTFLLSAVNGLGKNVYFLHKLVNQLFGFKNNKAQIPVIHCLAKKFNFLSHPRPDFILSRAK